MLYWSIDPALENPSIQLNKLNYFSQINTIYSIQPENEPRFLIEVNAKFKSTQSDPKPGYVNAGKKDRNFSIDGAYWVSGLFTLHSIKTLIQNGFIIRYGVKNFGTKYKQNFISEDFIFLDFDFGQTIEESIDLFADSAFLIYTTPSYTPTNQKHRVVFRLSETAQDWQTVSALLERLIVENPNADKSCIDASRISYPTLDPQNGIVFYSETNTLPIPTDPEFIKAYNALKTPLESSSLTNNTKYHSQLIKSLTVDFEGDLNGFLVALGIDYDFDFKPVTPDFEGLKWVGYNPFSQTNSSGTSLVCSVKDGKILFYDRSSENEGATIYGLIDSIQNEYSNLVDNLDYENFKSLQTKIYNTLSIKSLDYAVDCFYIDEKGKTQQKDIVTILHDYIYPALKGFLYHTNNIVDSSFSSDLYYVYTFTGWIQSQSNVVVRRLINDKFIELFGIEMPSVIVNKINDKLLINLPDYLRLSEPFIPSVKHQFFKNGCYDLESKTLIPYSNKIRYFVDDVLPYNYTPSTSTAIEILKEGFQSSGLIEEDQEILIKSLILITQNQFFRTQKFLYFYGITTSGKSAIAQIFARMFNSPIHSADVVNRTGEDYIGTYIKRVTVLDEVVNLTKIMSTIMTTIRDTTSNGIRFRYRSQHEKQQQKVLPFTLILTGEVLTLGRTNTGQQGQSKRIIPIEFNQQINELSNPYKTILESTELLQDLLCWGVEQDYSQNQSKIDWLRSLSQTNSTQSDRLGSLLSASDPFFDFISSFEADPNFDGENFDEANHFTSAQLLNYYQSATNDFDSYRYSSDRARLAQKFTRSIKERFPKFCERRKGRDRTTYYYGVVYNAENIN